MHDWPDTRFCVVQPATILQPYGVGSPLMKRTPPPALSKGYGHGTVNFFFVLLRAPVPWGTVQFRESNLNLSGSFSKFGALHILLPSILGGGTAHLCWYHMGRTKVNLISPSSITPTPRKRSLTLATNIAGCSMRSDDPSQSIFTVQRIVREDFRCATIARP